MRRLGPVLMIWLLLGSLAACGQASEPQHESTGPVLRLFAQVNRIAVDPQVHLGKLRRLGPGDQLTELVPARAFPEREVPRLAPLGKDQQRYGTVLSGCREKLPPELVKQDGRWVARFPADRRKVECFAPEYYVAVFDVPAGG